MKSSVARRLLNTRRRKMISQRSLIKYTLLVSCLMLVVHSVAAAKRNGESCTDSIECCSRYCRGQRCINFGDAPDDKGIQNPCNAKRCECGEVCVLRQVTCVRFPCRPIAECAKKPTPAY